MHLNSSPSGEDRVYVAFFRRESLIRFVLKDGAFFAPDKIDESTVMPPIDAATAAPLRLNFSAVRSINSYGIRRLVGFIRTWRPRALEFYDCSSVMVDTINIVRDLLGTPPDPAIVKSFAIPFFCSACDEYFDVIVKAGSIAFEAPNLGLAARTCPRCNGPTEVDVEPEEHLAFLEN